MGQYRAHSVADLPPDLQARIKRVLDAPSDGLIVLPSDVAQAAADLARPADPRQRTLDLTPVPSDVKVYNAAKYKSGTG
jgi:hypothetical protein